MIDVQSAAISRRNFFTPGTLHASTAAETDACRATASPSDNMMETSPIDCPFAAAVAVAIIICTVDVDVGLMVSIVRYSVLAPIHLFMSAKVLLKEVLTAYSGRGSFNFFFISEPLGTLV